MDWTAIAWIAAIIVGSILLIVGAIVAVPAIVVPPLEAVALTMVFGGIGLLVWSSVSLHSHNRIEKATAEYERSYFRYERDYRDYRQALKRAEESVILLGVARVEAVSTIMQAHDALESTGRKPSELGEIHLALSGVQHEIAAHRKAFGPDQSMSNSNADWGPAVKATGLAAGTVGAVGAYGLTATFGTAGTGTAIGTLSGAASHSATLAALGAGPLPGGLGMVGGGAILGGIVTLPASIAFATFEGLKAREVVKKSNQLQADLSQKQMQLHDTVRELTKLRSMTTEETEETKALTRQLALLLAEPAESWTDAKSNEVTTSADNLVTMLETPIVSNE